MLEDIGERFHREQRHGHGDVAVRRAGNDVAVEAQILAVSAEAFMGLFDEGFE